jgi:putative glutamine amidotransferase
MGNIIGITTRKARSEAIKKYKLSHLEGIDLINVSSDYSDAISDQGGIPLLIPILQNYDEDKIKDIIKSIDGLLLTGGKDIHPRFYQTENISKEVHELMKRDPERDSFELALLKEAFRENIPILGICRGHQLINISFGGTLINDIETSIKSSISHLASLEDKTQLIHEVQIKKNSLLNKIYQKEVLLVNSFHHQCIKKIANSFEVIAESKDQVIEGIIHNGPEWIVGIQWHPEMLYKKYEVHRQIFKEFIKVVNEKS